MDAVKKARLTELEEIHRYCDGDPENCPLTDEEREELESLQTEEKPEISETEKIGFLG